MKQVCPCGVHHGFHPNILVHMTGITSRKYRVSTDCCQTDIVIYSIVMHWYNLTRMITVVCDENSLEVFQTKF